MKPCDSAFARELRCLAREPDGRCMAALPHHLDFAPPNVAVPSGAERLHRRFLRREPPRVTLKARASARLAVGDFAVGEHALAKPRSRQRSLDRPLDTIDFD